MTLSFTATLAVATQDKIGDGPVWDAARGRLLWVDHGRSVIHEVRATQGEWRETKQWTLGGHITYAVPRVGGGFVIAAGHELRLWDENGASKIFARLDIEPEHLRMNDVKCDRRGRLWTGTFSPTFSRLGAIYRIDLDGTVHKMEEGIRLANGLDWNRDGTVFYFIDSLGSGIDAFDFDLDEGTISNRRKFVSIDPKGGLPNGMSVDSEDCVWVALTCGGEVCRYGPDGTLLARVPLPVPGVTSCAFGGPELRDLFITTRSGRAPEMVKSVGVPEAMMESTGPSAGALHICRPGIAGLPMLAFPG